MKRITDEQVSQAIKDGNNDAEKLSQALKISKSNAYYRIRAINNGINKNNTPSVTALLPSQDARKLENVDAVEYAEINDADYIPGINAEYKARQIDADVLKWLNNGNNALLISDAGSGKTTLAEQLANKLNVPFLRVAMDDTATLKNFIGKIQARNGATYFKGGALLTLLQRPSVILFDEFNALPSSKLFFLHELLDGRRFFVNDANGGRIINVHNGVKFLLACNPNNARYNGTNKMNTALIDRCVIFDVPRIEPTDVPSVFNCNNDGLTTSLMKFYVSGNELIKSQDLRLVFSLRSIKRIATAIRNGINLKDALNVGFFNQALLTSGNQERQALQELAKVIFGINAYNGTESQEPGQPGTENQEPK